MGKWHQLQPRSHRILGYFGLEGTLEVIQANPQQQDPKDVGQDPALQALPHGQHLWFMQSQSPPDSPWLDPNAGSQPLERAQREPEHKL